MQPKMGEFCWYELATGNTQAAKEFYGEMFGWKFDDHQMGDTTYTMIKLGDQSFGGIWQIPTDKAQAIPPHWMGYILVDDIKKAVEKAERLEAKVKVPVTAAGDYGLFAVIIDPTGAHIAFWENLPQ